MGVRLIVDESEGAGSDCVAMYDSTSGTAFGPVMPDRETAEAFLEWLGQDARRYDERSLLDRWVEFKRARDADDEGF